MSDPLTIKSKGTPDPPEYLDFELLRQEGLRHIQELSGAIWTDHNVHDPGITILEALCYALTDLDYRSKLGISDLLARPPEDEGAPDDNFFTAAQILTNNPLTILDYRKLLIDIPGVRNAWFKAQPEETGGILENWGEVDIWIDKTNSKLRFDKGTIPDDATLLRINGLYKVYLELEPEAVSKVDDCGNPVDPTGDILAEVERRLQAHRNLCEDFRDLVVLRDERIGLCARIELKADVFPDEMMLQIIEAAREFLSPTLPFYTLRQMIDKGKTPDEIFEGRPLMEQSHGFIDPDDLKRLDLRKEIHVSDLYGILLKIPGIDAIKKLSLFNYSEENPIGQDWLLPLHPESHRPVLAIAETLQGITFYKRDVPFIANSSSVLAALNKLPVNPKKVFLTKKEEVDLTVPKGQYRPDLGEYQSIQHEFPAVYGIGADGLPDSVSEYRKIQALQLKGYLLFYDQLLANYLAQLANLRTVFSTQLDEKNGTTTFAGNLSSVPQLDKLIRNTKQFSSNADGFSEGEKIAELDAPAFFSVPQDRDYVLQQILTAFDNGTVDIGSSATDDEEAFVFTIGVKFGREIVLRSLKKYASEREAQAAFERVRFLATLRESYELTDDPNAKQYSLSLVYKPVDYPAYLRNITESSDQFYERKNQFFNHLLRRFAEDFTDYTLLTFALSRKQGQVLDTNAFNRRFARDKAAFLADYPKISRNRGQAFNYAANVLDPDNISGLERRINRLIGIPKRASKRLNYFEVVPYKEKYFFEYRDLESSEYSEQDQVWKGTLLFRSRLGYDTAEEAQAAGQVFVDLAKNPENYLAEPCPVAYTYSFKVLDADGCEIAYHPETYGSATLRDDMMRYAQNVISGKGLMHSIASNQGGWVFQLKNGAAILLESAQPAKKHPKALSDLHKTIEAARLQKNYCPVNEPYGRGYGFEIATGNRVLARHPIFYSTAASRDTALMDTWRYIDDRNLALEIDQLPTRCRWQLRDRDVNILLRSIYFFKSEKQTAFAFLRAMKAATDEGNFKKKKVAGGKFTFELLQRRKHSETSPEDDPADHGKPLPVGAAPELFDTEIARDQAIQSIVQLAREISDIDTSGWDRDDYHADHIRAKLRLDRAEGHIEVVDGDFFAQLRLPGANTPLMLVATTPSATALEAQIDFYEVLKAVRNGQFQDFTETGPNPFGFNIRDEKDNIIAEHPVRYKSDDARRSGKKALSDWVVMNSFDTNIEKIENKWWFEFWRKPCGKQLELVLKGAFCNSPEDAETIWLKVIEILKSGNGKIKSTTEKPFRLWIENNKNERIAEHPKEYQDPSDLEKVKNELLQFVKGWPVQNDVSTGLHVSDLSEISCSCISADRTKIDANPYTWRVLDEEERIARNARRFPNKALATQYAADLHRQYLCHRPRWSSVWTEADNFAGTEPLVRFALRDAQQYYWQSIEEFSSIGEAQKAFTEQYLNILELARRPEAYREFCLPDGHKVFRIVNAADIPVAESYPPVPADQDMGAEMERLLDHARHYPICRKDDHFSFRLFDAVHGDAFWQSLQAFDTPTAAVEGLKRFTDLLLYGGNYQVVPMKCDWGLEIVEVLLESHPFFTSSSNNNITQVVALNKTEYPDESSASKAAKQYHLQYLNQLPQWTTARMDAEYKQQDNAHHQIVIRDSRQRYWKFPVEGIVEIPENGDLSGFDAQMINILTHAQEESRYIIKKLKEKDWEIKLKDKDNNIVAQATRHLKSEAQALAEKERLIAHARLFPICKKSGGFGFGLLYEPATKQYLWSSPSEIDFDTVKEAMKAFRRFLDLLLYQRNYQLNKENKWCIEIREELNNNTYSSRACASRNDPAAAWMQVEQFLDTYSVMGISVFEEYIDYHHCCGYGLRVVGEGYRLARLSTSYHLMDTREKARDRLFHQSPCNHANSDPAASILNWLLPENLDEQASDIALRLTIVNALRYSDSYTVQTVKKGNMVQFRLGLIDTDGKPLLGFGNDPFNPERKDDDGRLFYKTFDKEESAVDAIRQHIAAANRIPIATADTGTFRFEHRVQTGTEQQPVKGLLADECTPKKFWMPVFETKWESIHTYNQLQWVWKKYQRFLELLDIKYAYARTEAADGSPTLMIVDPDFELAFHPRTYTTRAEREIAREKLIDRLNTEGMHLIEHVLLRPRRNDVNVSGNEDILFDVVIDAVEAEDSGDELFDDYIVGADPYSFITTIVLPYWPSRFRDNDFRAFFENTLRRESPAHVMPRIFWIRPQQMKDFEKRFFCWLHGVGNDACTRPMVATLQQLQNVFIDAFLYECNGGGGNFIILDETFIN